MPVIIFSEKGAWPCRVTPKIFRVPPNISGSDKATHVKFGRPIQRDSLSKSPLMKKPSVRFFNFSEKKIFGVLDM